MNLGLTNRGGWLWLAVSVPAVWFDFRWWAITFVMDGRLYSAGMATAVTVLLMTECAVAFAAYLAVRFALGLIGGRVPKG